MGAIRPLTLILGARDRPAETLPHRRERAGRANKDLISRMAKPTTEGLICSACRREAGGRIIAVTMKTASVRAFTGRMVGGENGREDLRRFGRVDQACPHRLRQIPRD